MKWQVIKNRTLLWLRKILLYSIFSVLSATILSFLILQIPAVQQSLITRYLGKFGKLTDFEITMKSFHLVWYDRLTIEGLKVVDPGKNTLIDAQKLKINFSFFNLNKNKNVNIDGIELDGGAVNLTKITDTDSTRDLNINILIDRINKLASSGKGGKSSAKVNIGEIVVFDSRFIYNDNDRDTIKQGFDYYHFNLTLPEIQAQNFKVIGDTIQFRVDDFGAIDHKTNFEVKQLTTFFRISQGGMEFLNLNLQAGSSIVTDTIIFKFKSTLDLSDFNNKVNIDARFKNTILDPEDLALFAPQVSVLNHPVHLDGNIRGKVNRFSYRNMQLKMGSTSLVGSLDMDGLPAINETFIDLKLKKGLININDISFVFPKYVFNQVNQLGTFQLQGNFTGFPNDFVANGNFENRLGKIISDINLKIHDENVEKSVYEGNLQLIDFNIGEFLKDTTTFQRVSLKGRVNGKGLSKETADFKLNGSVFSLGLRGYNYTNIVTNARFASSLFSGKLTIDDPNLQFTVDGSIDFRKGQEAVSILAKIDTADLYTIGLVKNKFSFKSDVKIDTRGLQIDSIVGDALLKNVWINFKNDTLQVDSVNVVSTINEKARQLAVHSSLVDVQLEGDYSYTSLFSDLRNIFHEFYINIINDKTEIQNYYSNKRKITNPYEAKFQITLHDVNPLIKLFSVDASVGKETKIEGTFSNGLTSIFKAYSQIDTVRLMNHSFFDSEIEFNGSKIRDSTTALAALTINSEQQLLAKNIKTKNLLLEGIWNKDHIALNLDLDQQTMDNQLRLKSEVDFLEDSTKIKILPSRIHILNKDWLVSQSNYTLLSGKEWSIHHLQFANENKYISLDGAISENPEPLLNLEVSNLDISMLNIFSTEKFEGILNGKLAARDLYHSVTLQNDVVLKDFKVNEFLIGDITGINKWD
ncbi:MAG TPA: hypothetical protein VIT44_11490, partial [Cyclobacteriaceae bacterium]